MATKYAGATEMAETITAMLTVTSTPAIPTKSRSCNPTELKVIYGSNGMTGNVSFEVSFTNISDTPCYLQAWPQAILTDGRGNPLDVDYSYQDLSAGETASASTEKNRLVARVGSVCRAHLVGFLTLVWSPHCHQPGYPTNLDGQSKCIQNPH